MAQPEDRLRRLALRLWEAIPAPAPKPPRAPRKPGGRPRAKDGAQRPESHRRGKPRIDKRSPVVHDSDKCDSEVTP